MAEPVTVHVTISITVDPDAWNTVSRGPAPEGVGIRQDLAEYTKVNVAGLEELQDANATVTLITYS